MPLLKGSIELWEADACLDVDGAHQINMLFGDTKALQRDWESLCVCLAVVVSRLFFVPALHKASSSAQSESMPTTLSLLPSLDPFSFALSPAWYVRVKGIKRGLVGGGGGQTPP